MKKLDEVSALAIVFGNTRRKKRKENLVTIAKAFEYLLKAYGSQKAVAKKVGLSSEMIRQFLTVLKLSPEVQKLFSKREIDSVDVAKELVQLKDPRRQIAMAKKITNITNIQSKDARDVKRITVSGKIMVKDAVRVVLKQKGKKLHLFMLDLDDDTYRKVRKKAKALNKSPSDLVRKIVIDRFADIK